MDNINSTYEELSELLKDFRFSMVTFVTDEGHLHSAPMTTQNDAFNGIVWFLGSKKSELVKSISSNPQVNLGYSNTSDNDYVSINGVAENVIDEVILDEIWSPAYEAFFEHGKSDPDIQLIRVVCNGAQYWKGSGTLVTLYKLAKASVTGETEDLGTSKSISL
ncbi:pyridoxamine 5'-phosphate oxidase family protein [Acinetobacter beijerinckii]|uniref:pyridoxamine 5'-phosphate oxidase family protein n=1 Tax=Acinetobacter beijerinckii TaxID=262668 RepID=UPI0023DDB577|nr:pyridoxamine 5'-phosphate oxidase family protein [Acinetobacter beijerinckii]MDF2417890.1 pyridoxamine 5'-phosphate oxidase family protein [Acinetobacter beijerinckii]